MRDIKSAQRGAMKVFNFELTDENGGCIRIGAFNEMAEKYYSVVQKGSMYYVSGGTVKGSNKRFNSTGHDYEISLRSDSEVVPCTDRGLIKPKLTVTAVPLSQIPTHVNSFIDVLAVIEKVHEPQQITQRTTGETVEKRDVELIDESGTIAVCAVWGDQVRLFDTDREHQIIVIKGASVREYNGSCSLSSGKSGRIEFNVDCNETHRLASWYQEKRPHVAVKAISRGFGSDGRIRDLRVIDVASELELGKGEEKGVFFSVIASISSIKTEGAMYKSCGTNGCRKKVVENNGQYRCEKCNVTSTSFKYLFLLTVEISDFSGSHWVSIFDDQAAKLLGKSADELGNLLDQNRLDEYNEVLNAVRFRQFSFRLNAKNEFYNDTERIKWKVFGIEPVDYDKYTEELQKAVDALEGA